MEMDIEIGHDLTTFPDKRKRWRACAALLKPSCIDYPYVAKAQHLDWLHAALTMLVFRYGGGVAPTAL